MNFTNNTESDTLTVTNTQTSPPWMVIIHDDPVNLMDYVTMVIEKVLGFNHTKSIDLMKQVHHKGKAIVWSGAKEKAEFYVQQLHSFQLHATLEIA